MLGSCISYYIRSQELYSRTSDKYLHPNLVCNGSVWDVSFEIPSYSKNNNGFIYYKIAGFYRLPLAASNSRIKDPAVKSIHLISHISSSKRREYLMFVWKFQAILKINSDLQSKREDSPRLCLPWRLPFTASSRLNPRKWKTSKEFPQRGPFKIIGNVRCFFGNVEMWHSVNVGEFVHLKSTIFF